MSTNLSAVLYGKDDLRMEAVPVKEPKEGEVLVSVRAGGVCHTDVHMLDHGKIGNFDFQAAPTVIGHELSGVVSKVGPGVANVKPGDRIAVDSVLSCGSCSQCKRGRLNTCLNVVYVGISASVNGGLARYTVIPAKAAYVLPDSVDFEEGAFTEPLAVCVNAVNRSNIALGDTVLVLGAGPIGLLTLQVARARGAANVCVADINSDRLQLAKKLGASHTVLFSTDEADARVSAQKILEQVGEADSALECTGAELCIQVAVYAVRAGGCVTVVGIGAEHMNLPITECVLKEVDVRGAAANSFCYPAAIKLMETGQVKVKPIISHRFLLDELPHAIGLVRNRQCNKVMIDCSKSPQK